MLMWKLTTRRWKIEVIGPQTSSKSQIIRCIRSFGKATLVPKLEKRKGNPNGGHDVEEKRRGS